MRAPLVVAATQPRCESFDVAGNVVRHAETVRAAAARVVVFPELSLTGYELDADAITADDPRLEPIIAACAETGSVALAGAPVTSGDRVHIAVLAIRADGVTVAYRKMWLGDAEAARFDPGPAPGVIEVDGWRLGLAVCKDTGIARHAADTIAAGADAYLAGTVKLSTESDLQHERARRIAADHGVWVVVSSFAGPTGGGFDDTAGRSGVWRPGGDLVTEAGPHVGDLARATLTDQ